MKKILILLVLFLAASSFKVEEPTLTWVSTFEVYLSDEDGGSVVIVYRGNIPPCLGKKMIDFVYIDCDTVRYTPQQMEDHFHIKFNIPEPIDSACINEKPPMKTTRI